MKTNLATTNARFAFKNGRGVFGTLKLRASGVTFARLGKLGVVLGDWSVDTDEVWLEGTGHLIAAFFFRRLPPERDLPIFHGL